MGRPGPETVELDTLAGLIMHLAGHLPAAHEALEYRGLKLVVKNVDYNRIDKVLVMDREKRRGE
jgi:CBS domain containing-hemolysin-like protein